ncbi:MAG TPA: nucleotidyltransferase family protein [Candidatus Binataceae bacterium]|nr:nucleotidyltransferase family protein [Candidatus Binataceae bacterium]
MKRPDAKPLGASLPSEAEFILACIANPAAPDSPARARALAAGMLDWDQVRRIANWHGVMPIVYRFLCANADAAPQSFAAAMRADFFGNALRNVGLARELARISGELEALGIGVIALKGPALAISAYGDLALRQFSDLDILIHERDLPRVADLLAESGYYPRRYERDRPDGGYFQSSEDEFSSQDGARLIDVHWRLVPSYFPFAPDADGLWERAVRVPVEGCPVATLAPIDAMMFVIAHATKHGWPALRSVCDVAALAARAEFDFTALAAQAAELGCMRILLLGAALAADPGGARIAPEILAAAAEDPHLAPLTKKIRARMFAYTGGRPKLFNEWMVPLAAIERLPNRIRYCLVRGFKPTIDDWEILALPRPLYPLYWAIRPFRLLAHHGPRLIPGARLVSADDAVRR